MLALISGVFAAAPARASDHLMKINEIFVGTPGGPQFVELLDSVPEPFPLPPYKLVVYNPSGAAVGRVTLPAGELIATGTSPYLVANAAQGGAPDEPLTATLPPAGQVCYTRGAGETRIHCVSYGCGAGSLLPSEGGSERANTTMLPSWSAQRQPDGSFGVGSPTPDAANIPTAIVPCEAGPGPRPGGGSTADRTKPVIKLGGRRRQRFGKRLSVSVTVNENATVTARGSVRAAGRRKVTLKRVKRSVRAGKKVTMRFRLSRKARVAAFGALAAGRKVTASLSVTATDAAKNSSKKRRTIRIVP